jgi:Do/DeqQ family serine protease
MNSSSLRALAAMASLCAAALPAFSEAAPAYKMPDIKRDASAVSDGRTGLVSSYADVVEPVQKEVVSIESSRTVHESVNPMIRQLFPGLGDETEKEQGLGSGVIVSSDGFILTNNHVIDSADSLTVDLPDGRKFPAKVVGADPKTDIAVVKIDATGLPAVTFADSDKLRVGDVVFAVGNPLGVGETVTMGIVSAKGRTNLGILDEVNGYEDFIQTDAAINMGNSGGALVDAKGRLVGINSAIVSPSRGNIGIGFAVPVNMATTILKSLIETGSVSRGYLGVTARPLKPDVAEAVGLPKDTKGVIVTNISPDSPADKAGLKRADVILSFNGKAVSSFDELRLRIAQTAPGSKVSIEVSRDGKPVSVTATLGQSADKTDELFPGVEVEKLSDEVRKHLGLDPHVTGLVVTAVDDKSDYAQDLPVGAVVIEINRSPVEDLAGAKALLHPGHNLLLIYFKGAQNFLVVTVR